VSRRLRKKHLPWLALAIAIFIFLGQRYGWFSRLNDIVNSTDPGLYAVTHYIDGDTIMVNMNGSEQTIRFIGIDTPETHKPNTPVQCYGPAAAAHTKAVIANAGGKVRLQSDALSSNRDRYDRLLRYVYLANGTNVNLLNVQQGYAFYYPYFPYTKSAQFESAQKQARAKDIGLWRNCHPTPSDDGGYKMDDTQAEASASADNQ
jgi:micrococcal nuclease